MSDSKINAILNDLLIELHRSLLQYASEAWPWSTDGAAELKAAVLNAVEHQRQDAGRLVHLLQQRGHAIDFGMYPAEYTSLHYVALEYLHAQLKQQQSDLVVWIGTLAPQLASDPEAALLVKEIGRSEEAALGKLWSAELPDGPMATSWMK